MCLFLNTNIMRWKFLILSIAFLVMPRAASAQNNLDIIEGYKLDTAALFCQIKLHLCENKELRAATEFYPIYLFGDERFNEHSKEEYLDYSFMNTLCPRYIKCNRSFNCHTDSFKNGNRKMRKDRIIKKHEMLETRIVLIGNGNGHIAGLMNGLTLKPCFYGRSSDSVDLVAPHAGVYKLMKEGLIDFVFTTSPKHDLLNNGLYYFLGINLQENKIYVILDSRHEAKMIPIEDVVNDRWEDFQNGLHDLYYDFRNEMENKYGSF